MSAIPPKFSRSASLCGDSPPNFSHFHEVLFLGKIKSSHKRAPPTFIDDSLKKFRQRDAAKQADQKQDNNGANTSDNTNSTTTAHPLESSSAGSTNDSSVKNEASTDKDKQESSVKNRTMLLQVNCQHKKSYFILTCLDWKIRSEVDISRH